MQSDSHTSISGPWCVRIDDRTVDLTPTVIGGVNSGQWCILDRIGASVGCLDHFAAHLLCCCASIIILFSCARRAARLTRIAFLVYSLLADLRTLKDTSGRLQQVVATIPTGAAAGRLRDSDVILSVCAESQSFFFYCCTSVCNRGGPLLTMFGWLVGLILKTGCGRGTRTPQRLGPNCPTTC